MGTGQARSWHPRPRGSRCLGLHPCHPHPWLPTFCQSQHLAQRAQPSQCWRLPSPEPRKPRASTATVLPGPPTGDTGGAGKGHGGCWGSLWLVPRWPHTRGCPLCPLRHMRSLVLVLVAQGGAGLELRGSVTLVCPQGHTHEVAGLCWLPQALLPRDPRGGAGALPRSLGLSAVNHRLGT